MKPAEKVELSELYIVYTEFINMVVQKVRQRRMLPVEIVKTRPRCSILDEEAPATADVVWLYTFEPSLEKVLDDSAEVHSVPYPRVPADHGRASETASRQKLCTRGNRQRTKPGIDDLTRKLNASRRARITQNLPKSSVR